VRFEWDEKKDLSNQSKHHLSFDNAREVFDDPLHISKFDQIIEGEQRWNTIGVIGGLAVVIVAHTYWDNDGEEVVRIISARRASRRERREYENG
jgi:uncharacterized DUF497 family protein